MLKLKPVSYVSLGYHRKTLRMHTNQGWLIPAGSVIYNFKKVSLYCHYDSNWHVSPFCSHFPNHVRALLHRVVTHPSCTSASTQLSHQHFSLPQNLCNWKKKRKKTTRWLTLDQEENGHCVKEIIPTTWSVWPEQLCALLTQHKCYAFKVYLFFFSAIEHVWSKIFWHDHIFYVSIGAEPRPLQRNQDRKNKERAGRKKNTRRGCFESPNRLLPSIFSGWNFSLAVRRNSNRWSSCPQPAGVEKTSTAHALTDPLPHSSPMSPSQVINGQCTPKHNMALRGIETSCCDM